LILPQELSVLPSSKEYELAVQVLHSGGIVAYPTETYYGLAVDPANDKAVAALYRLKLRESHKTLSFIVPDLITLSCYTSKFPPVYKLLTDTFWPGPLTLICHAANNCTLSARKRDNTLAFRISSHPVAQKFCSLWGGAITASSANISGEPALSSAEAVKNLWGSKISYVLDGGKTSGEAASTVVYCHEHSCEIIRNGVVTEHALRQVLPASYKICKI
jgi:L-threonylcarbamoyladenylate synthase